MSCRSVCMLARYAGLGVWVPGIIGILTAVLQGEKEGESDRWAASSFSAHVRFGERGAPVSPFEGFQGVVSHMPFLGPQGSHWVDRGCPSCRNKTGKGGDENDDHNCDCVNCRIR